MSQSRISRRNLILAAIAVAGAGGAWYMTRLPFEGQVMTPDQAHALANVGALVLVDIRRPDEWEATGVGAGASPIDMRDDEFITKLKELVGDDLSLPVALICARGVRSNRMSQRLKGAGFTQIIDVPEGMLGSSIGPGWLARGLPVEQP